MASPGQILHRHRWWYCSQLHSCMYVSGTFHLILQPEKKKPLIFHIGLWFQVYLSEISHPDVRGHLGSGSQTMSHIGGLALYALGT